MKTFFSLSSLSQFWAVPHRVLAAWFRCWLMVTCFAVVALAKAGAATVSVQNYVAPGYVVDSQGTGIAVQAGYLYTLVITDPNLVEMELRFRLLDPQGNAVPLLIGGGESQDSLTVTDSFARPNNSVNRTVNANLRPAARLIPGRQYRVEATVVAYEETVVEAVGHPYIHFFQNGAPGRLDAVLELLAPTLENDFLVTTIEGQDKLRVTTPYQLHRYREDGAAATVNTVFNFELVDELGNGVAMAATPHETAAIAGVAGSGPAMVAGEVEFEFSPGAQLDPVNRTYSVRVIGSHNDSVAGTQMLAQNTVATLLKRILHFNGVLRFGSGARQADAILTDVINEPVAGAVAGGGVATSLVLEEKGAVFGVGSAYTFGNPAQELAVRLMADGVAVFEGLDAVAVDQPANDESVQAGVRLRRVGGGLSANASGLVAAQLKVQLPAGLGWGATVQARVLSGSLTAVDVPLTTALLPSGASIAFASNGWFSEESKPVMTRFMAVSWTPASGSFAFTTAETVFVRGAAIDSLEAQEDYMTNPAAAKRRSNDHYYRAVQGFSGGAVTVTTGLSGEARLTGTVTLGPLAIGQFLSHFPYADDTLGTSISFDAGQVQVMEDRVVPSGSHLSLVKPFTITFDRSCAKVEGEVSCPTDGVADFAALVFTADNAGPVTRMLRFTRDGGLSAQGDLFGSDALLQWGKDPAVAGRYAQELGSKFDRGGFHMPGHMLAGGMNALDPVATPQPMGEFVDPVSGPAAILLSGVLPFTGLSEDVLERPGVDEVKAGDVIYGYQVGEGDYAGLNLRVALEAKTARSVIGDFRSGFYDLAAASKYYVRWSGVSGRHQALDFAGGLVIYGYDLTLTQYGLGYLSNRNEFSITEGSISIPAPSDVTFPFEAMRFSCTGGIKDAEVPEDLRSESMLLGPGYWNADFYPLAYIFAAENPCVDEPQFGVFVRAFCSLMPGVGLNGPLGFNPNGQLLRVSDGNSRLNSRLVLPSLCELPGPGAETWKVEPMVDAFFNHHAASPNVPGFLNLVGRWQTPFFRGTAITVHTTASETPVSNLTVPYQVMGQHVNITTEPLGDDPDHLGYPHTRTLAAFREAGRGRGTAAPNFTPKARALWLGVTNLFDFEIVFDPTSRTFKSLPSSTNLFVVETRSSLELLTPAVAKLDFGLDYGIKRLDLTGFVTDASQRGTDWLQSLTDAAGDELANALKAVVQTGENYTKNNLEKVVDRFLDQTELADDLVALRNELNNKAEGVIDGLVEDFAEELKGTIRRRITEGMLEDVNDFLDEANAAVPGIQALTTPAGLATAGRSYVSKNVPSLAGVAAKVFTPSAVAAAAPPGLDDLNREAGRIPGIVTGVKIATNNGPSGVEAQLEAAITAAQDPLKAAIKEAIVAKLKEYLVRVPGGGAVLDLATVSDEEFEKMLRDIIVKAILQSPIVNALRQVIFEKIDQVAELYRGQFRGIFSIINAYVQAEATRHLGPVDKEVNGILGPLRNWLGTGELIGNAEVVGDVLRELRLDGKFQWKCPKNLEYRGTLSIKQLHTQTDGGACVDKGAVAHEIALTARDVAVDFMISDFKADITGIAIVQSFPDKSGFDLKGLGAKLESSKPMKYEGFTIERIGFGASISPQFGAYLVGVGKLKFGSYDVGGGLFFGSSCTLEPLAMIDPEFAGSIGTPPFAGAYAYGMGRAPLIGSNCALRVTIGVGAGFFYLLPGPTVGVRMTGEVSGEALCLLTAKGRLDILAKYNFDTGNPYAEGQLRLTGKAGKCSFCVRFGKTFRMAYVGGKLRRL